MGQIVIDQTYFGYNTFWNLLAWTVYLPPKWKLPMDNLEFRFDKNGLPSPRPTWKLLVDKLDDRFSKSGFSLPPTNKNFPWTIWTNLTMMVYSTSTPKNQNFLLTTWTSDLARDSLPPFPKKKKSHLSRIMCEIILNPGYGEPRFFTSKLFIDLLLQRSKAGIDTF